MCVRVGVSECVLGVGNVSFKFCNMRTRLCVEVFVCEWGVLR